MTYRTLRIRNRQYTSPDIVRDTAHGSAVAGDGEARSGSASAILIYPIKIKQVQVPGRAALAVTIKIGADVSGRHQ
jgi:hypothetical protein